MIRLLAIILSLFLASCETSSQKVKLVSATDYSDGDQKKTRQQFESRDLNNISPYKRKTKVALLLPMSGKSKALGESLFNSAVLSLFENDVTNNLELVLFDSSDSSIQVKEKFQEIVNQGIKIVVGPVFSNQVEAIANQAVKNDIVVISLSNNVKLANNINSRGGIFLAGMMPEVQIDKIVSYSISKGKNSFAVIAPNNQYGIMTAALYKKMVKDRDGVFVISELYSPNGRGIENAVYRVVNAFSVPSEMAEGGGNKLEEDFTVENAEKTYAQIILIPESGKNLSKIVRLIEKENIEEREFQIIGTSQWDDISTLNDPELIGSWFVAPDNEKFRNFERLYYQSYSKFPPRIASISYDAILSIANLIRKTGNKSPKVADFVSYKDEEKNGFVGVDGMFRYVGNGLVQRNLAVLEVGKGRFNVIEKPTEDFLLY